MKFSLVFTCFLLLNFVCSTFDLFGSEPLTHVEYSKKVRDNYPFFKQFLSDLDSKCYFNLNRAYTYSINKKPSGIFIEIKGYNGSSLVPEFVEEILIWDTKRKIIELEKLEKYKSDDSNEYSFSSEFNYLINSMDYYPYYGSYKWYDDVISLLKDKNDCSDEDLEILARAYANIANNLVENGQFGTYEDSIEIKPILNYKLSQTRLNDYLRFVELSLINYEKIKSRNQSFQSYIFKDISMKISHEYMHVYYTLKNNGFHQLAVGYLKRADYRPEYVQWAKSYLEKCDQNSFLFTYGDSDTYPLWYVQDFLHFRKDIKVINRSLLASLRHQFHIRELNSLKLNFDLEKAYNKNCYAIYFSGDTNLTFNLMKEQVSFFNKVNEAIDKEFIIDLPLPIEVIYKGRTIKLFSDKHYLTPDEIFILDVLKNFPSSKIYFTSKYEIPSSGFINNISVFELSTDSYLYNANSIDLASKYLVGFQLTPFERYNNFIFSQTMELAKYIKQNENDKFQDFMMNWINRISDSSLINNNGLYEVGYRYSLIDEKSETESSLYPKKDLLNYIVKSIAKITFSRETYSEDIYLLTDLSRLKNSIKGYTIDLSWNEVIVSLKDKLKLKTVIENQVLQREIENCIFSLKND